MPSFCYHGDCLSSGGGYELATITRCCVTWGKFNELLPVLTSCSFPITSRGRVYNPCVRSVMLHASETWAPTFSDLHRLQGSDRAMIHWMCGVTTKDQVSLQDLLERMRLDDLAKVLTRTPDLRIFLAEKMWMGVFGQERREISAFLYGKKCGGNAEKMRMGVFGQECGEIYALYGKIYGGNAEKMWMGVSDRNAEKSPNYIRISAITWR